jgi:hypothetical protein
MATAVVYGPALPSPSGRLSISTSSRSSISSSESPRTATTFSFSVRYMQNGTPPSPLTDDVVPKVEEIEDDEVLGTKSETPPQEEESEERNIMSPTVSNGVVARRPRGRPRKHPKTLHSSSSKQPKGRSKTGCITCRRRKKKCDETKPACLHCQKNNVHCEGYPPKDYWQSGKHRSVKGECSLDFYQGYLNIDPNTNFNRTNNERGPTA